MKKTVFSLLLFSLLLPFSGFASYKYWVQFTDKDSTTFSLATPSQYLSDRAIHRRANHQIAIDSTDLPIYQAYIDSVLSKGTTLHSRSRWFNGITVSVEDTLLMDIILQFSFVKRIEKTFVPNLQRSAKIEDKEFSQRSVSASNNGYGNAFEQIDMHQGTWLHQAGFMGQGMEIAVLDAGFLNVNSNPVFAQARNKGQILGTRDFVDSNSDVYAKSYHGGQVLSILAAYDYDKFIGTAPEASYWLIRTEDAATEFPVEMDNMVAGMEFADSVGVDIISASLGYFYMEDSTMSLTYNDLDGKTLRASIAETMCARKGILLINSAGNEGAKPWHYIAAPSDADSVLTVGSVTSTRERSSFSSFGPTADGRIKPTVAAMGTNAAVVNELGEVSVNSGTSMAAPVISGLAACLWQALPSYSNMQILDLIKNNSNNVATPNNEIGYGIPDFYAAYLGELHSASSLLNRTDLVKVYPNPTSDTVQIDISSSILSRKPEVQLMTMLGRKKLSQSLTLVHTTLLLQDFEPGMYILVVKLADNSIFRQKLIKE